MKHFIHSHSKAKLRKISGNMKGDGFQNGGLIIVAAAGEKVLFSFKQESPADHTDNEDILSILGIRSPGGEAGATAASE